VKAAEWQVECNLLIKKGANIFSVPHFFFAYKNGDGYSIENISDIDRLCLLNESHDFSISGLLISRIFLSAVPDKCFILW
jgi:hypothetical protein